MTVEVDKALRFAGSAAVACVVVAAIMVGSLWAFGFLDRPKGHHAVDVNLLSVRDRLDLAEVLGERRPEERPRLPVLEDIPPLEIPKRRETGFVQVEVDIDAQGTVTGAEVVRSVPEGLFEAQALEIVRSRQYEAGEAGRLIEMVEFTVGDGSD